MTKNIKHKNMSVLVYVENAEGKFKKSIFEAVSYAKAIATQMGTNLVAISIGDVAQDALVNLGTYGAEKVLNVNNEKLKTFVNQAYASVISFFSRCAFPLLDKASAYLGLSLKACSWHSNDFS